MPDAAQYTLGLFDTSALGWAIPTPAPDTAGDDDTAPDVAAHDSTQTRATNYRLAGERRLARGWRARARDNIEAIRISKVLEDEGRAASPDEQERMLCFTGFGSTELAQSAFPLPGETTFRESWEEIGRALREVTTGPEYAVSCSSRHQLGVRGGRRAVYDPDC
jgi:hypothetical protein